MSTYSEDNLDVAVIGMSARFPMAKNVKEFWENIIQGKDCITRDKSKNKINYIAAYGKVEDIEYFDADFFGFNSREAMNSDPQQRFMLEGIYEALEDAGYNSNKYKGKIGLYSTCDEHLYIWNCLMREMGDWYLNYHLSEFNLDGTFNTLIAYKLNLQGPCVLSKYACASSLAAIHQAYQGLLNYECDMAVAGGVCLEPEQEGYNCFDSTVSRSGYTKSFDEEADGMVRGSGQGIVILKRLEDALKDNDKIIALIKGTNLNNDGNRKVGFSAPSVQGQEEAILDALTIANVKPSEVGYFETHGTGTVLGDTVELRALKNVFMENPKDEKVYIGSVKSNIGHTSTASGVANFVKACLMLNKKIIPASINFIKPNSELLEEDCPVVVNNKLRNWESNKTRIAGVSSFGMGGANAIVILSEYQQEPRSRQMSEEELFVISAKTDISLKNYRLKLAEFLRENDVNLKDMAYTLQVGRGDFEKKFYTVCGDKNRLIESLESIDNKRSITNNSKNKKKIVFAFSGAGSHGDTIGKELYESNNIFKKEMDTCLIIAKEITGEDFKQYYVSYDGTKKDLSDNQLAGMIITFAAGYSLAKVWIESGVKPDIIVGHSLGEYIGACISGVFTLETALKVIIKRAELFTKLPEGSMLGVALTKEKLEPMLTEGVTIGAENGNKRFLVTGLMPHIKHFEDILEQNKISYLRLPVNRAGHCPAVNEISDEFREVLKEVSFGVATIPIVSTYTGNLVKENQMSTADYWINQMMNPVKFGSAIKEIAAEDDLIFIEIGLSDQLTELIRKTIVGNKSLSALSSIKEFKAPNSREGFLNAVGKLYCKDVEIYWEKLYDQKPYRVSLPTYQFDRKPYWKYKKYINGENNTVILGDTKQVSNVDETGKTEEDLSECRNSTDKVLKEIIKEVLGVEEISIYDDLYECGFDSLSVVFVTSKVETILGKRISMKDIYSITTIAELSDLLETKEVEVDVSDNENEVVQNPSKDIDDIFGEI